MQSTVRAQNAPSSVAIDNFTFTPQRLTVKAGVRSFTAAAIT